MSKKPQPQKKDQSKNKPQIVDQQNELFLLSLKKKMRTINKRLTEIAELEVRQDLKPEQVEKVNRKESLEAERERIEEFIGLYKQHLVENAEALREIQQGQLSKLARGVAVLHSSTAHQADKEQLAGKLSGLWNSLKESSHTNQKSLTSYISSINSALFAFANDSSLQEKLTKFVTQFGQDSVNTLKVEKIEQPVQKTQPVQKPELKIQKVEKKVEEAPKVVFEEKKTQVVAQQPSVAPVTPVATVTSVTTVTPVVAEPVLAVPSTEPKVETEAKPAEGQVDADKKEGTAYQKDDRRDNRQPYRGRGNNRGNNRDGNRGDGEGRRYNNYNGERKVYKPKNEAERKQVSSDSDQSPESRNFRNQEIKKLQEDGFQVVGKPKPKAKDQKEQRQFHQNQHGKKSHHHGHPN